MSDLQDIVEAQTKSMTEMHLKIKALTADVAMYKDRMEYWQTIHLIHCEHTALKII